MSCQQLNQIINTSKRKIYSPRERCCFSDANQVELKNMRVKGLI